LIHILIPLRYCPGMAKCVNQRFAANAVNIIADGGLQRQGRFVHDDAKTNFFLDVEVHEQ
jgi:hypothetical protein